MLESKLQAKIIKTLKKIDGCYVVKYAAGPYSAVGVPDLLGCINGRMFGIEVKAPGGEPTKLQLIQLERLREAGAAVGVAWSIEDALEIVSSIQESD